MVAVAVEPNAAGVCAQGVAFVAAFLLEEIVAHKDLVAVELQGGAVGAEQIAGEDYLVEAKTDDPRGRGYDKAGGTYPARQRGKVHAGRRLDLAPLPPGVLSGMEAGSWLWLPPRFLLCLEACNL